MGVLVRSDEIIRVGLSDEMRQQIRKHVTCRHNNRIRDGVRRMVTKEIVRLEGEVAVLRQWLHANKRTK